jgi:hypothetical protein
VVYNLTARKQAGCCTLPIERVDRLPVGHVFLERLNYMKEIKSLEHELKCWPVFFSQLNDNSKNFEVRRNDRDYQVGDTLLLREYIPETKLYTKRSIRKVITSMLKANGDDYSSNGIVVGWCVIGIADIEDDYVEKEKTIPVCKNNKCNHFNLHYGDSNCKQLEDAMDVFHGINCDTLNSVLKNICSGCMDRENESKSENCINCKYCDPFKDEYNSEKGRCMYNTPFCENINGLRGLRPFVIMHDEWCSKFERRSGKNVAIERKA